MSVEVRDNPGKHRYEAFVDGERAGIAAYTRRGDEVVFTHTQVTLEGHGVGSTLVRAALDDVRRRGGLTVVPTCPFVAAFIERHQEYAALLGPDS